MTKQTKQIYFFLLLAIISYSVWKIFFDQEIVVKDKPFTKGYSVDNLELRITDEEGNLSAKFNSPSLIRYTDSEQVLIKSPELLTFENGQQNWQFNSIKAIYNHKIDKVSLIDDVTAVNKNEKSKINFTSNDLFHIFANHLSLPKRPFRSENINITQAYHAARI